MSGEPIAISAQHLIVVCETARYPLCSRYVGDAPAPLVVAAPVRHGRAGLIAGTLAMALLVVVATAALLRIGNPFTVEPEATAPSAAAVAASPQPVPAARPSATAAAAPPTPSPAVAARTPTAVARTATPATVYVVKAGDSLTSVAAAHGVSLQHLAAANGLPPTARLSIGQRLTIPAP